MRDRAFESDTDARGRPPPVLPPSSPEWMAAAFAHAPRVWHHQVDGAAIEVLEWGAPDAPPMVLVHGLGAHADWWRFIAPQLAGSHRVLAPSLSGMGGSDWREHYSVDQHAREIAALVKAAAQTGGPVTVVAHSHGSIVTLAAARLVNAGVIRRMALIDFFLNPFRGSPRVPPIRSPKTFATPEEAIARFRLAPPQDCANPALLAYIAARTVRRIDDGETPRWSWVTDQRIMTPADHGISRLDLAAVTCPLLIILGERSRLVNGAIVAHICATAPAHARFVAIPDADHHVLLDQPLALVAALRAMLALA